MELKSISFAYEEQPETLRSLSLSFSSGEKVAVIGGNGAGKSTLFLCCNGVLQPQKGEILLRGQKISAKKKDLNLLRQSAGVVFQDPNQQFVGATVEEEISFGPMNLCLPEAEVRRRVEQALQQLELGSLRDRPPHLLSGGEKKRLSIAGVLAMQPELILLDEPTAFLDGSSARGLEGTLADLHSQGKTLVLSTHDMDFVYRWADRALLLLDGRIAADGLPQTVFGCRNLLDQAGLQPPILYELAGRLKDRGLLPTDAFPKTLSELTQSAAL